MYNKIHGGDIMKSEENNKNSNNITKSSLKYRSPNAVLADFLAVM